MKDTQQEEKQPANPEELLKPRYKVIAGYPLGNYEKDEVINLCMTKSGTWVTTKNVVRWLPDVFNEDKLNELPGIFKKLEWYEDREVSEMPEYVKEDGQVYKVSEWHFDLASMVSVFFDSKIHGGFAKQKGECPLYGDDILPATKEEYDSFIKSKSLSK